MSLRIRKTITCDRTRYFMTLKQKSGDRIIEIEKKINERDFTDLWEVALNKLEKIRYDLICDKSKWEVDFFKDHYQHTYFAQAEHEMPEGQLSPKFIPKIINKNLLFAVPIEDDRFGSKRLANVKHAKELYLTLTGKEIKNEVYT